MISHKRNNKLQIIIILVIAFLKILNIAIEQTDEIFSLKNAVGLYVIDEDAFMNINELEQKFILNFWRGEVVMQEKDRHVITTERSLLFAK